MFPIKPGTPASLTGNMGELRAGHFHGGIDIRTGWALRWPVLASADGYVSRVKVSSAGYGNVIYIRHPNGYSTVYAHLEVFGGGLADFVRQNQYHQQSFEVDLSPDSGQFTVQKGQIIALSGNSGGSGGPHLHFEIRDSADAILNPLNFNFEEITDRLKPYFRQIALRTLQIDSRINDKFGRIEYNAKPLSTSTFGLAKPIVAWGKLALDIIALDRINNGSSRAGISCLEVYLDDKLIHYYNFNKISDTETGHINSYIDFEQYQQSGQKFLRCYLIDGNPLKARRSLDMQGHIHINTETKHILRVVISDAHHNISTLIVPIIGKKPNILPNFLATPPIILDTKPILKQTTYENILKLSFKIKPEEMKDSLAALLYFKGKFINKYRAYYTPTEIVFLHDLRNGLPDSIRLGGYDWAFDFNKTIAPQATGLKQVSDYLALKVFENSLLDTLYLQTKTYLSADTFEFKINSPKVALINPLQINFKPSVYPARTDKLLVFRKLIFSKKLKFVGGKWKEGSIDFVARTLGDFCLAADSTSPKIVPAIINKNNISIKIYDSLSGIASFRATLNGSWLLMNYDHKRNLIWAEPLNSKSMEGFFELQVTDLAGNMCTIQRQIK